MSLPLPSAGQASMPSEASIPDAVPKAWGLDSRCICTGMEAAGSPSRVHSRLVLESGGRKYVLECLPPAQMESRERQAELLSALEARRCPCLLPWLPTLEGRPGLSCGGWYWQLREWRECSGLPRDAYGMEAWRGAAMAEFLVAMRRASLGVECGRPFMLAGYIRKLLGIIGSSMPGLCGDLEDVLHALGDFAALESGLPLAFCHGDFHPLNVLWAPEGGINAVIDWEFCGMKPSIYDMANLLGCIGVDDPAFLTGPMAGSFIEGLWKAGLLDKDLAAALPAYVVALRFAWMREWFIGKDMPMIVQELDFMWLVIDNMEMLRGKWSQPC